MPGGRYAVGRSAEQGVDVYTLRDAETGATASVAPELGANCFRFSVPHRGSAVDVLLPPPSFAALREQPSGWGTPVLFPFPSRIVNSQFVFQGRTYRLEPNRPNGQFIHGLVIMKPFQAERAEATDAGAAVTCTIHSADFDEITRQFPWPFVLRLRFTLSGARLITDVQAENVGNEPMPMGFGSHPYFPLPLVPGGDRRACRVRVPADRYWSLNRELIPGGERPAVSGKLDLRSLRALGDDTYDNVFTALRPEGGWTACRLEDPLGGLALTVRAQYPTFREWVIYAPPTKPTICFEPYTCSANAPNLQAAGFDAGLVVLQPGERWQGRFEMWTEVLPA